MRNVFLLHNGNYCFNALFLANRKNGGYTVHAEIEGISGSDVVMMIEDPSFRKDFE